MCPSGVGSSLTLASGVVLSQTKRRPKGVRRRSSTNHRVVRMNKEAGEVNVYK